MARPPNVGRERASTPARKTGAAILSTARSVAVSAAPPRTPVAPASRTVRSAQLPSQHAGSAGDASQQTQQALARSALLPSPQLPVSPQQPASAADCVKPPSGCSAGSPRPKAMSATPFPPVAWAGLAGTLPAWLTGSPPRGL